MIELKKTLWKELSYKEREESVDYLEQLCAMAVNKRNEMQGSNELYQYIDGADGNPILIAYARMYERWIREKHRANVAEHKRDFYKSRLDEVHRAMVN